MTVSLFYYLNYIILFIKIAQDNFNLIFNGIVDGSTNETNKS